jgi:hypothetical protein
MVNKKKLKQPNIPCSICKKDMCECDFDGFEKGEPFIY